MSTKKQSIIYEAKFNNAVKTGLIVTYDLYQGGFNGYVKIKNGVEMDEIGDGLYFSIQDIDSRKDYIAIFNAGTNDVDGGRIRFGQVGNTNNIIEDFKKTVTSRLGAIGNYRLTDEEIRRIIEAMKEDEELIEKITPKLNDRSEEIIKMINDSIEGIKIEPVDYNPQFINILDQNEELKEEIGEKILGLKDYLEKDPEVLVQEVEIENTEEYENLKYELYKIAEFIKNGEATNLNKLQQILKYIESL